MKKNSIVLNVLAVIAIIPTGLVGQESVAPSMRERAMAALERAKAASPNAKFWAENTVAKAKRKWSCFMGNAQCSPEEISQARKWIIGVPAAIISAFLVAAGVKVTRDRINDLKKELEQEKLKNFEYAQASDNKKAVQQIYVCALTEDMAVETIATIMKKQLKNKFNKVKSAQGISQNDKDDITLEFQKCCPSRFEIMCKKYYNDDGTISDEFLDKAIKR